MNEKEPGLEDYWKIIWRRKWVVILSVILVTASAAGFSFLQTPIYEASTTLHLKKAKSGPEQIEISNGASLLTSEAEINTQIEILNSRTIIEEVARRLPPTGTDKTQSSKISELYQYLRNLLTPILGESPPEENQEEKPQSLSEIVTSLRESISVASIRDTRLIKVSAFSDDPEIAQLIVNTTAQVFIERNISSRRRETTAALDFLTRETAKVKENLRQTEEDLKEYKQKEGLVELSEKTRLTVERLSNLESQHESARISRQELKNRLTEINSQLEKVNTVVAGKTESINPIYTELYTRLVNYETEINALQAKEDALASLIAEYGREVNRLPQQELTLARLQRSEQANADLYSILVKAKNKAEIESASEIGSIGVVDPALRPDSPVKPKKKLNTLLGLISGLILGAGLAFVLEYTNKTIKTEDEAEKLLNFTILGAIPRPGAQGGYGYAYSYGSSNKKKRKEIKASLLEERKTPIELITRDLPKSHISEAYRSLITNLQFVELDRKLKTLMVTSSIPREGKTSVVINLAITLALAGEKVLLVDTDLRLHRIHKLFNLDASPGLTDLLAFDPNSNDVIHSDKLFNLDASPGLTGLLAFDRNCNDVIHSVEGVDNLDLLTSGSPSPNPSELLRSSRMKKLILELQKQYDRVLFDSSPLLGISDASILSSNMDGVLLVLGANEIDRQASQKAKQSLEKVKAHILGLILNKVDPQHSGYGKYYYYYSHEEDT